MRGSATGTYEVAAHLRASSRPSNARNITVLSTTVGRPAGLTPNVKWVVGTLSAPGDSTPLRYLRWSRKPWLNWGRQHLDFRESRLGLTVRSAMSWTEKRASGLQLRVRTPA